MMSTGKSFRQKSSPEFWIEAGVDQDGFEKKFISRLKGYGVFSKRNYDIGDFLLEYSGELLVNKELISKRQLKHEISSKRLAKRGHIPRFHMFHFRYNGKKVCIDATYSKGRLAQYVNDAKEGQPSCNAKMKLFTFKHKPRLLLFASRNIETGEEISFDYGDENNLCWRQKEVQDVLSPVERSMSPAASESSNRQLSKVTQPTTSLDAEIPSFNISSDSNLTKHSNSQLSTVNQPTTSLEVDIPALDIDSDSNSAKHHNSQRSTVTQPTTSFDAEIHPSNIDSDSNPPKHSNSQLSIVNQPRTSREVKIPALDIEGDSIPNKHSNSELSTVNRPTTSLDIEIPPLAIDSDGNPSKYSNCQPANN